MKLKQAIFTAKGQAINEIMLWKRWALKFVSSDTEANAAWSAPTPNAVSDRLATAIIIHLLLESIQKDSVIDYSILIAKQLMKKNTA